MAVLRLEAASLWLVVAVVALVAMCGCLAVPALHLAAAR